MKEVNTNIKTTEEIQIPKKLIEQVIGQDQAVEVIKKAAVQKRHVLLVGEPGTGKSMLGLAMAELLPKEELQDILVYPGIEDKNNPEIKVVPAGEGKQIVSKARFRSKEGERKKHLFGTLIIFGILFLGLVTWVQSKSPTGFLVAMLVAVMVFIALGTIRVREEVESPKLLVSNQPDTIAPFVDGTGAHAGALLGDVRHDPFQCIPDYEQVQLPNGRPIKISKLLDRFFEDKHPEEIELHPNQQFQVLAGFDDKFGFIKANVVKVFRRFYDGALIELETRRGYKIRVTPNHPIAIFNANGTVKYIEATRIKKGILSIVPYKLPIETKEILNKEKLLLYADILADGYVGERSVIFKLRREFKIKWILTHIQACGLKPNVLVRNKDTLIYINSAEFVRELSRIGLLEDGKKKIPSIIFDQPAKNIKTFIAEYFAIDGYVGKQGQFELISKELISDFVSLLLKIGIKAKVRERIDRGFGKGKIQPELIFSNYEFAKFYYPTTINPYHRQNLRKYLRETRSTHVTYDDNIPLGFDVLERLRDAIGLSRARIHKSYYAMNPKVDTYTTPTRGLLRHVVSVFQQHLNCSEFYKLRDIVYGSYGFDEIVNLRLVRYKGYVYNVTTTTGNYLVNNILTHNSGGLETPAHERVEAGAIHRAHKGVLFIDEIATLGPRSQQELLTAMQEKAYPITGQSERSSGAMTRTKPVPCDFILIAAGNLPVVEKMHPALRSRMRGYGYEVYMNDTIPDTPENQEKLARFVAQEVIKDGKIPHFAKEAVEEIIREARRRSGRKGHLTLRLRDLGGLIRAAGDIARSKSAKYVELEHVLAAKDTARTLEKQLADRFIERKKEYQVFKTVGAEVGRVNGLAVIGPDSGVILPIVAEVAPALSREEGRVIATGKLGEIAKEAVQNVSALIKKYTGQNIKDYDIHVQFIMSHEGVEGDSASISVATAVFSALEGVPVDQSVAMTGSLSVRGEVLPVGGTTPKIEAAVEAGIKKVLVPKANEKEVFLEEKKIGKVEVIPVESITDVLEHALVWRDKKDLLAKLRELAAKTIPRIGIFEREKPTPT
ncbi:MAG: ATP-dependent protease LonB [Euryarchaeota archaeon]|nr:ATP-dependent protease LonB [Euryarchaeota archaeon]